MEQYHLAWLSAHPTRDEKWLAAHLSGGFDIHHLDGDHENNDPQNLVLLESSDHMLLHGGRALRKIRGPSQKRLLLGKYLYGARHAGQSWAEMGRILGCTGSGVRSTAHDYARNFSLTWPVFSKA